MQIISSQHGLTPVGRRTNLLLVIGLALLVTVLNAFKPPVIDDPVYLSYAREFAAHPAHPYHFDYYGKPGNNTLVPPVLPTWMAIGIRLFGPEPAALKLWLFPILVILVGSLNVLLTRFAHGLAPTLLVLTVLSPALLPNINLMLDIPALAFGLAAMALYLHAAERRAYWGVLAAGLLAGVAMQTKYTAFTIPGIFILHAWLSHRLVSGAIACLSAVIFFVGCEGLIAFSEGDSHFWVALLNRGHEHKSFRVVRLIAAEVTFFGSLASILGLVGLTALGVSRRIVFMLLGLILAGFVALFFVPSSLEVLIRNPISGKEILNLNHLLFVPAGLAFTALMGVIARRLPRDSPDPDGKRTDQFLVGWFLIEAVGYLMLSPFPAVRRVLGMLIAATFLIGRLAFRSCPPPESHQRIHILTVFSGLLGLLFYSVELRDALAEREAFQSGLRFVQARAPSEAIRFHVWWGMLYYGEIEHLEWMQNGGEDLRPGDWLLYDPRDHTPFHPDVQRYLALIARITVEDPFPLATQRTFYQSRTAIVHCEESRAEILVYRYLPPAE